MGYDQKTAVADIYGAFATARNDVTLCAAPTKPSSPSAAPVSLITLCPGRYDGALEMLSALQGMGLSIGTVTNGNADATKVPGLCDRIDFAVDAHGAGAAKPAPPIFLLAVAESVRPAPAQPLRPRVQQLLV